MFDRVIEPYRIVYIRDGAGDLVDVMPNCVSHDVVVGDIRGKHMPVEVHDLRARLKEGYAGRYGPGKGAMKAPPPKAVVGAINSELLHAISDPNFFVTAFYLSCRKDGTIYYVNAGHNPGYLLRADGRMETIGENSGNIPLGVYKRSFRQSKDTLHPGDSVVLYTDGISEARRGNDEYFGEDGILDYIVRNRECSPIALAGGLFHASRAFGSYGNKDDATVCVVRMLG